MRRRLTGKILTRIGKEGFEIIKLKSLKLSRKRAAQFYSIHRGKPFYNDLVKFMSSGRIVVALLAHKDAVAHLREIVGATNPREADPGTIRNQFGTSIQMNVVHASDSKETAAREIAFFFDRR